MTCIEAGRIRSPAVPARAAHAESGCRFIESLVATVFGVSATELLARSRGPAPVALARQTAMYLAHVDLGLSLRDIGAYFGRDRTTVAHACARIEDRRDDPHWARLLDHLEHALREWCRFSSGSAP